MFSFYTHTHTHTQKRREWLNEVLETLSRQPDETQLLKAALSVLDIHSEKEILK